MTNQYAPSADTELTTYVRALTKYEDSPDELPQSELETHINIAKMRLTNSEGLSGSDPWYSDGGLSQALLGVTCILTKAAVENYSVTSWTIGDQDIDVRNAGDEEKVQFQIWNDLINEGLESSDESDGGTAKVHITNTFIGK